MPKPSTNSDWMRSTRHGSVCTQSVGPRRVEQPLVGGASSATWPRRSVTGPRWRSLTGAGSRIRARPGGLRRFRVQLSTDLTLGPRHGGDRTPGPLG